jgi:hypothetical protein
MWRNRAGEATRKLPSEDIADTAPRRSGFSRGSNLSVAENDDISAGDSRRRKPRTNIDITAHQGRDEGNGHGHHGNQREAPLKCLPDLDAAEHALVQPYLRGLETYLSHGRNVRGSSPSTAECLAIRTSERPFVAVARRSRLLAGSRSMSPDGRSTMATDAYDDPILDWDDIAEDLAMLKASDHEERLQIDWETPCYLPALGGGGMQRMIPVYGPESAWIRGRRRNGGSTSPTRHVAQPSSVDNSRPRWPVTVGVSHWHFLRRPAY